LNDEIVEKILMKKLAKAKKKKIGIKFERKTPKEDEI
jgi:hypothetical protein